MPTMVMSQPPKKINVRKLQKSNKQDNIMPINYMYVGTPKKKFTFYVRERLVYRPSVEVTYDEVFSYLVHATNDETISLHYSVNGSYVSITTTGQLHTFLRLIHGDPNAFLYVENNDYVWNVTPQSEARKLEKRMPSSGANEHGQMEIDQDEDVEDEDSQQDEDVDEESQEYDDEEDEEEEEEEMEDEEDTHVPMEEQEAEPRVEQTITDTVARVVLAQEIRINDAFVEPKAPAAVPDGSKKKNPAPAGPNEDQRPLPMPLYGGDGTISYSNATGLSGPEFPGFVHFKAILVDAIATKSMDTAAEIVAGQLIRDVWNKKVDFDEKVFRRCLSLLKNSVGAGLLHYYQQMERKYPDKSNQDKAPDGTMESILIKEFMRFQPTHDAIYLAEFIENATIAACDIVESAQHLAQLQREFDYFNDIDNKMGKDAKKKYPDYKLPSQEELSKRLNSALVAAHYGFEVLEPAFPQGCACKDGIRVLVLELEKMLNIMRNVFTKTHSANYIEETKAFVVETVAHIIERYVTVECTFHNTVQDALGDAEAFKWRNDAAHNHEQWAVLRSRGENRLNVSQQIHGTKVDLPLPFTTKPAEAAGDAAVLPMSNLNEVLINSESALPPPVNFDNGMVGSGGVISQAIPEGAVANHVSGQTLDDQNPATPTTPTPVRTMSAELKKMIEQMYKDLPPQHNHVYPTPPKAGSIIIPTGGLARCRCSKNCTETLMEPAYEYVERFNEPRQTVWEKTKQKRFKKN